MVKSNIIETILKIVFVIFALILIAQLLMKLTGHSPSELQILYLGFGGILTWLFAMTYKIGGFFGEFKEFREMTKENFHKIEAKLQRLEQKIDQL